MCHIYLGREQVQQYIKMNRNEEVMGQQRQFLLTVNIQYGKWVGTNRMCFAVAAMRMIFFSMYIHVFNVRGA